jgi:protein-disulfide isomerase
MPTGCRLSGVPRLGGLRQEYLLSRSERILILTRRRVLWATAAVALAGVGTFLWQLSWHANAETGNPNERELAKAGPNGDIILGSATAPVTIIEYASMTCPHCAHFAEKTLPELQTRYIDTGKVRFIFREFPLDPLAAGGFMLARCAGKDKYMQVVETLFARQR